MKVVLTATAMLLAAAQAIEPRRDPSTVPTDDSVAAEREKVERLELMKRTAAEYEIFAGPDLSKKLELRAEPILRWANPVRDAVDAASFLWVLEGRPQVAACIYISRVKDVTMVFHEFQSLAQGSLNAERQGKAAWNPRDAGVELKPVPGAPTPAAEAPFRLTQMRTLAREFSAT